MRFELNAKPNQASRVKFIVGGKKRDTGSNREGTLSEGSRKEAVKIEAGKGEEERSRSAGRSHYGFR